MHQLSVNNLFIEVFALAGSQRAKDRLGVEVADVAGLLAGMDGELHMNEGRLARGQSLGEASTSAGVVA